MKEVAPLRYSVIFKKAFSEPEVFKGFVRDFLGVKLEINRVETEKSFPKPVVDSHFDLFAEDTSNGVIVDIQHVRHGDPYRRFFHYHCAALLEYAAKFTEYNPKLTVFTLVVLISGDKHKNDMAVIDFAPKTLKGRPLKGISHKVIYISPKYLNDDTPEPCREWMQAIQDSQDGQVDETKYTVSEVLRVFDLIEQDTISPEEMWQMTDERREEKHPEEKKVEGVKEGEKRDEKTDEKRGKAEEAKRTAMVMRQKGMDTKLISEITNLPEEEILQFKQA